MNSKEPIFTNFNGTAQSATQRNKFMVHKVFFRIIPLAILVCWLLVPILFTDPRFLIHDNLDSNVVWMLDLVRSGKMFSSPTTQLDHIFNGIPRYALQPELNFYTLLYAVLPPKSAYLFHYCFMHVVAYIGFVLLAENYILKNTALRFSKWIALAFAMLPFWPTGSLSIAGMPLLLWAMLNFSNKTRPAYSLVIIILYPFFSSFFFSTAWFIALAGTLCLPLLLIKSYRSRSIRFMVGLAVLGAVGVIIEWRLFYAQLFVGEPSHRTMWALENDGINWKGWLGISAAHFLFGHYHFYSLHLPIMLFALLAVSFSRNLRGSYIFWCILGLLAGISLIGIFQDTIYYKQAAQGTLVDGLNLRFISLAPFLWFALFAFTINELSKITFIQKWVLLIVIGQALYVMFVPLPEDFRGSEYVASLFYSSVLKQDSPYHETWEEYYMVNAFEEVKRIIPKGTRVACVGIPPEIARYNGFKTVGGYQFLIPLGTKRRFNSLLGNPEMLMNWDSRSYLKCGSKADSLICDIEWDLITSQFNALHVVSDKPISGLPANLLNDKTHSIAVYKYGHDRRI